MNVRQLIQKLEAELAASPQGEETLVQLSVGGGMRLLDIESVEYDPHGADYPAIFLSDEDEGYA